MNEKFLKVEDIMEILGISKSAAYKLMRELNEEMVCGPYRQGAYAWASDMEQCQYDNRQKI